MDTTLKFNTTDHVSVDFKKLFFAELPGMFIIHSYTKLHGP
jgi:hypothetical protein